MNINLLEKIIPILKQYTKPSEKVVEYISAADLSESYDFSVDKKLDEQQWLGKIEDILKYSVKTIHPQFNNQLYAGTSDPAFIGEIITSLTNTSMATYEIAPFATLVEKELCKKLNSIVGYKDGEGIMVTGGSNANMLSIHCARQTKFPNTKKDGNQNVLAAFVSDQAHYSFSKAFNLMGLGLDNLIKVKSNELGEMIPSELEKEITKSIDEGKTPFYVASTTGTTVLGAFDPVKKIDIVAKKYDLWHHIDGAWGGPVLLSEKHRKLIEGSELSDSFTWDAHKLMSTGLITTYFLTKHKGILQDSNNGGGSTYIFHEYENSDYDTGPDSLQCGRKVDSIKFWLHWLYYGDEGLENEIDSAFNKAEYFEGKVKESKNLQLVVDRNSLNVCFQVIPKNGEDINLYNLNLRYKMMKEGKFLTNFSRFADGTIFFRHVFVNSRTTMEDVDNLINYLEDL